MNQSTYSSSLKRKKVLLHLIDAILYSKASVTYGEVKDAVHT